MPKRTPPATARCRSFSRGLRQPARRAFILNDTLTLNAQVKFCGPVVGPRLVSSRAFLRSLFCCRWLSVGAEVNLAICERHSEDEKFSPKLLSFVGNRCVWNDACHLMHYEWNYRHFYSCFCLCVWKVLKTPLQDQLMAALGNKGLQTLPYPFKNSIKLIKF